MKNTLLPLLVAVGFTRRQNSAQILTLNCFNLPSPATLLFLSFIGICNVVNAQTNMCLNGDDFNLSNNSCSTICGSFTIDTNNVITGAGAIYRYLGTYTNPNNSLTATIPFTIDTNSKVTGNYTIVYSNNVTNTLLNTSTINKTVKTQANCVVTLNSMYYPRVNCRGVVQIIDSTISTITYTTNGTNRVYTTNSNFNKSTYLNARSVTNSTVLTIYGGN
jgi:hypothetical protein